MKQTYKVYQYTAVFQTAPEGGYTVTVPALPGCISEGDSFEGAKKNIAEAIELYLEVAFDNKNNKTNYIQDREVFSAPVMVRI